MNRKKMIRNIVEKSNRSRSSGTPFPIAHEQMQKLLYWYQSELSNKQLVILLLTWLKDDFNSITAKNSFPRYYRLNSSESAKRNALRIIRLSGVSWVEYSVEVNKKEFIWMPVPIALKGFFWRVLQQHSSYKKPILSAVEMNNLYKEWMRKVTKPRLSRGVKMSNKTAWANYIGNYCNADTSLSSNSKLLYLSKLHHSSSTAYQIETIESIRYQLFNSINNSIKRLFLEATKQGQLLDFKRTVNGHIVTPNCNDKQAKYIMETNGLISEIKKEYKAHHHEVNKAMITYVGTKTAVTRSEVSSFFSKLTSELTILKLKAKSRSTFIYYYNQCTYIFALQLILLTSLRPTHQISPLLSTLSLDRFSVKDKGQSRNILLSAFLQEQVIRYQYIQCNVNNIITCSEPPSFLLFLVDDDYQPTQLTAKKLRVFMNDYWPGHVPYQLRKMFAQILMELKLPNHLLDRAMGHSRLGEHDGAMTVFPHEEKIILDALNQLPELFKMKLFDD
jgi:hypothetical protein